MSNITRLVKTLGRILGSAEENAQKLGHPMRDEDAFVTTHNRETITVGLLRAAVKELGDGELRIGNTAYQILNAPETVPTHKICGMCSFSENGRSSRACPRMTYLAYNRSLCTFFGDGSSVYFKEIG